MGLEPEAIADGHRPPFTLNDKVKVMNKQLLVKILFPFLVVALNACTDDSSSGTLSLSISDAPVDNANRVVVEFSGVSVKPASGEAVEFSFETARQIDLLALQGGASELLLDDVVLDAGNYAWVQLHVNAGMDASDSFIELVDGSMHALYMPSGNETGLKLVQGFTIPVNGSADFTIDFDLRKSITDPEAQGTPYILRPALRIVDNTEVGTIAGTVDASIANTTECSPAVYVYEGHDITPGEVGSESEPVASGLVAMSDSTGEFEYAIAFLLTGDYTVALTCDAAADSADSIDNITFEAQQNAVVEVNQTTTVTF